MQKLDATDLRLLKSQRKEALKRKEQFRQSVEDQRQRHEQHMEDEAAFWDFVSAVLATPSQIDAFEAKLDRYDTATIKALQENGLKLDHVREKINDMLDRAYVDENGRKLFRTKDGKHIFDEHGNQLSPEETSQLNIPDHHPFWEDFKAEKDSEKSLIKEREDILRFQGKLDDTRERIQEGDIKKDELDDLEKDIQKSMPTSVRKQLTGQDLEQTASTVPDLKQPFNQFSSTMKLPDMNDLNVSEVRQGLVR